MTTTFAASTVAAVGLSVFVNPGCVTFTSLDADGNFMGREAVTEMFRTHVTVRLWGEVDGALTLVHDFDEDTCGDAGMWSTWWCKGEI